MLAANNRTPLRRLPLIVTVAVAIGASTAHEPCPQKRWLIASSQNDRICKNPPDHQALAAHYNAEAAAAEAKAGQHERMALGYKNAGEGTKKTPNAPGTIEHCNNLVKNYKAAADDYAALAKAHESMASEIK